MPLVLGLISDQNLADALEKALRAEGFDFKQVARGEAIEPISHLKRGPAEPISGPGAGFIARLVEWQPALVLVETESRQIPWQGWIAALKSSPATRRIPVLALLSAEIEMQTRAQAEAAGCDATLTSEALRQDLSGVLKQYALHRDNAAVLSECQQPLSALAREGIALHNRGEFFEAHEVLEHAWNEDASTARELYRGLLQISVAYLQIERGNYNGALKMFLRMCQWLDPLPEICRGVHVAQARADALAARVALEALGPARLAEFNRNLFKPIRVLGAE